MGQYTQLHFNCKIKKLTLEELRLLRIMLEGEKDDEVDNIDLPDHPLFSTRRWHFMLRSDSDYFHEDSRRLIQELEDGNYYLSVLSNFKNYDDEINQFLDWIQPYIVEPPGSCLGFIEEESGIVDTIFFQINS